MMRNFLIVLVLFLFVFSAFAQLLNNPESVVYDTIGSRYLVSNYGDGSIVQIDSEDNQSYFSTDLVQIAGLYIYDDYLLVASNTEPYIGIGVFDLVTDELEYFLDIETGGFLNDITSDTSGYVYITDYWDSKLFRINITERTWELFWDSGFDMPNGITFEPKTNSIICTSNNEPPLYPLRTISLADSTMEIFFYTNRSSFDGIVFDHSGRLYLSSWSTNSVIRFDTLHTIPPETFSSGHDAPADIYFDPYHNLIAVPNFYRNTFDFIPVFDESICEAIIPNNQTLTCYPNPFNSVLEINSSNLNCEISIYDIYGNIIFNSKNNNSNCLWTPSSNIPSGVYLIVENSNNIISNAIVQYIK